ESSRTRTGGYLLPNPIAFVVPHAGLTYSGTVAAAVYRYLQAMQPKRIVLLGFSHRGGLPDITIPRVDAYSSPLGDTNPDRKAIGHLCSHWQFSIVDEEYACDHSVEIQLPLLRYTVPEANLVPLYVGSMVPAAQHAAASVLAELWDPETVFLASSDLTHFGH